MSDDSMIAALLRERDGYLQRGMADRVALVDEQLRLRGHEPDAPEAKAPETEPPKGRATKASRQRTTAEDS